jgi:hypothetical protein
MKYMINVPYLTIDDFNADGTLKSHVGKGKPVVMMVQGVFCGYCTQAKPDFHQFVKSTQKVTGVTLQSDGDPSEKKAYELVKNLTGPQMKGVPAYLAFNKEGKFIGVHQGGRDINSLHEFANKLV